MHNSPSAARSRNNASPARVSVWPAGSRPQAPPSRHPVQQRRTDEQLPDRAGTASRSTSAIAASQSSLSHPSTSNRPSVEHGRPPRRRRRGRSRPRPPRTPARHPTAGSAPAARPQPRRQQRSSVFSGGTVCRRGHWFSHCARNDCSGSGSSRSTSTHPAGAASNCFRDHAAPAAPSSAATPAATPPGRPGSQPRGADHSISRSPSPVLELVQRDLPALQASARSPTGAPSRPATTAAAPAPPSSASPTPRASDGSHLPRLIDRRHTHRVPVDRLLRPEHPPRPSRQMLDLTPARSPPAP